MVEPTTFLSFHDLTYHPPVSLRDGRRVDRRKIDLRGFQVLVAQALADYREVAAHVPHGARPCVAGHVCGKRDTHAGHFAYLFQVAVHLVLHPLVLHALRAVLPRNDGQQVRAAYGEVRVFVDDGLHGLLPSYGKRLACLLAVVLQQAVPYVGLPKVGHVDERHAMEVKAEHEHVAREGERRTAVEGEPPYRPDRLKGHGALGRSGKAGEHVAEDVPVGRKTHFNRLAVKRTQRAQIARRRIALKPAPLHPRLVHVDVIGAEGVEGEVLAAAELGEAGQRVAVSLGRAEPPYPHLTLHHAAYEAEPRNAPGPAPVSSDDVVGVVFGTGGFLLPDYRLKQHRVPPHPRRHKLKPRPPFKGSADMYGRGSLVPLARTYVVIGANRAHHPLVNHLEEQRAFIPLGCRRPEFQSYRSHKPMFFSRMQLWINTSNIKLILITSSRIAWLWLPD